MRSWLLFFFLLTSCGTQETIFLSSLLDYQDRYPTQPDTELTPGGMCLNPDRLRYPEQIPYCERDVDSSLKKEIIRTYDRELGYEIGQMNRQDFKIDHFIPLSLGGSNTEENLWPQHKSVYVHTDNIEGLLHQALERALLKQAEAVEKMRHVKFNLNEADAMEQELRNLIGR